MFIICLSLSIFHKVRSPDNDTGFCSVLFSFSCRTFITWKEPGSLSIYMIKIYSFWKTFFSCRVLRPCSSLHSLNPICIQWTFNLPQPGTFPQLQPHTDLPAFGISWRLPNKTPWTWRVQHWVSTVVQCYMSSTGSSSSPTFPASVLLQQSFIRHWWHLHPSSCLSWDNSVVTLDSSFLTAYLQTIRKHCWLFFQNNREFSHFSPCSLLSSWSLPSFFLTQVTVFAL